MARACASVSGNGSSRASTTTKSLPSPCILMKGRPLMAGLYGRGAWKVQGSRGIGDRRHNWEGWGATEGREPATSGAADRKEVVSGKRVSVSGNRGGGRSMKK